MERKIGETFEFEGKTLQVKAANDDGCEDCIFYVKCTRGIKSVTGLCESIYRDDKKEVIFVEVKEETKEPKERKVGEVFEYQGKKLKVMETANNLCFDCYFFDGGHCQKTGRECGHCQPDNRSDYKSVIFVEVKDEQPQEQDEQPQKLNLCEILKYCPAGEPFWSPMLGDVKFYGMDHTIKRACVTAVNNVTWGINADGTITIDDITSEEVMLYPSREQRDWTKVKYEPKKELPRTWEEFCNQNHITELEYFIDDSSDVMKAKTEGGIRHKYYDMNVLPSKQAAEAHLAYMQLHQLRDAWREGWVPDWEDMEQNKYAIINNSGNYTVVTYQYIVTFLAFQDKKRADEFKDCFIDLIRKAGDLI